MHRCRNIPFIVVGSFFEASEGACKSFSQAAGKNAALAWCMCVFVVSRKSFRPMLIIFMLDRSA